VAETGVVMSIYLDHATREIAAERALKGAPFTRSDLRKAIILGAVERVRPKMLIIVAIIAGLLPILLSKRAGSEVMRRIAVLMISGMVSSTVVTLVVIPAIYALIKRFNLPREAGAEAAALGSNKTPAAEPATHIAFAVAPEIDLGAIKHGAKIAFTLIRGADGPYFIDQMRAAE
jgi:Cu(I)/Ag(I) efflux system membrane protein CusA/SilA